MLRRFFGNQPYGAAPASLRQQQYRLYRSARGGVGGGPVDVGKIVARDEAVERHLALHKKIGKARDEVPRPTVALDHAAHGPAALQPRHFEADPRAGASAADQNAGAETSQPIYGEPKHSRHGRRLQREIGAAAGDPADFGERLGAAAFERMRGTEFASESQPAGSRSTAMIGSQPAMRAAIRPARPT